METFHQNEVAKLFCCLTTSDHRRFSSKRTHICTCVLVFYMNQCGNFSSLGYSELHPVLNPRSVTVIENRSIPCSPNTTSVDDIDEVCSTTDGHSKILAQAEQPPFWKTAWNNSDKA